MASRFPALFLGQTSGSCFAALKSPASPQLYRGRVFSVLDPILDLASGDIDDQLAELDWVAGSLETLCRHPANMAWSAAIGNPARKLLQSKLTHYQNGG